MYSLNETHDPKLTSWVESANEAMSDFPIQNLPFAVFRRHGSNEPFRGGVAIGTQILDLVAAGGQLNGLDPAVAEAASQERLNRLMALGPAAWSALRMVLSQALRSGSATRDRLRGCLVTQAEAEYRVPARIGDFTDFYTSIHHATNVGRLFRPENPLLPNYQWLPIGYHGRCSSIGVSGQRFHRPLGQLKPPDMAEPVLGPSRRVDYELELGLYVGPGNEPGERIALDDAEAHVFGISLLNDWSARDIQAWEYQPLGPFLAKSFATTVSPWIVTLEALTPYRVAWSRPGEHPRPLHYLDSTANRQAGAFDITLEVLLQTASMQSAQVAPQRVSLGNFHHAFWTVAQMVTHHTVNGCNLQPGDLLATGTQSGPNETEMGALIELTQGGKRPIRLANGEHRTFLEDGDSVVIRGWCEREGRPRIGFGEVVGTLLPARD
ncbi:MAG: fumarylacetoacetase [Gammaproteobacteria bacterium]|nr:fumarylacetoacetase [Gammaproteobacteria bacterium]